MRHVYIRCPQFLYDLRHPLLAPKWREPPAFRWYHAAPLAVIEWIINRFEMWNMRPAMQRMKEQVAQCEQIAKELEELRIRCGLPPFESTLSQGTTAEEARRSFLDAVALHTLHVVDKKGAAALPVAPADVSARWAKLASQHKGEE